MRENALIARKQGVRQDHLTCEKAEKGREISNSIGAKGSAKKGQKRRELTLYKKAGKDGQKIAGHASEGMTRNYQRDHEEIVWSEAIPDLNISEITG